MLAVLPAESLHVLKGLRILRALKPLRALSKSAGMRQVFRSLTLSLAAMGNLSLICLLFFLVFAILGVQLFGGKFYHCNDDSVAGKAQCTGALRAPCCRLLLRRVQRWFSGMDGGPQIMPPLPCTPAAPVDRHSLRRLQRALADAPFLAPLQAPLLTLTRGRRRRASGPTRRSTSTMSATPCCRSSCCAP